MYALTVDVLWLFSCQGKNKQFQTEQARNKSIKKDASAHLRRKAVCVISKQITTKK